ncbi:MAG: prepilin-type N-terminal cleavage/methylation domain-containing protein [Gammaproteobacteria bacterium]
MNTRKLQSGFTLVEIAIVLVIIGLLLGGILKGQELITSARVRNLADQNSGIQAAYYGFIDRYRQIPGDMVAAGPRGACNVIGDTVPGCSGGGGVGGNGNGRLDDEDFTEAANVWAHMSAAGFIQGNYQGLAAGGDAAGYAVESIAPQNVFQGFVMLTRSDEYEGGATPAMRNLFVFGRNLPVYVIRELDLKIDDGQPHTGVVRSTQTSGGNLGTVAQRQANCVADGGGGVQIWNINGNETDCNATFLY